MYLNNFNGCHDVLILGTDLIKWRQRPDMTVAVAGSNKQNKWILRKLSLNFNI